MSHRISTDLGSSVFIPKDPSSTSSACASAVQAYSGGNSWGACNDFESQEIKLMDRLLPWFYLKSLAVLIVVEQV